jgi:hypothetical protein
VNWDPDWLRSGRSMELPNYFFADLGDSAALSAKLVTEACHALKENREKFLLTRTTDSLITILEKLARDWLDPEFPFRKIVLDEGPGKTGFTSETLSAGLNRFFAQVTSENLERLIAQDLGSVRRLDEIVSDNNELKEERASIARGYPLVAHITGGVIPNPVLTSMMIGLLVRSAQFFKCAGGTSFIPRMFAHSLYAMQPKLASCLEIAEWKGGNDLLEAPLFAEADCVTATGSDETLDAVFKRVSPRSRFLRYGHKLSFGYITRESLAKLAVTKTAAAAANDIVAWNQLGCLSPHVIYLETGGSIDADSFAELLSEELARREETEPRGPIDAAESAAITTRRMFYEVRASVDEKTRVWSSPDSTAWTIVLDSDAEFQLSCLNRFVFIKTVPDIAAMLTAAARIQGQVSTVGLSAPLSRTQEIATALAQWGVSRICHLGRMQDPPLTWRHDGRPCLGDLVAWSDLEF